MSINLQVGKSYPIDFVIRELETQICSITKEKTIEYTVQREIDDAW